MHLCFWFVTTSKVDLPPGLEKMCLACLFSPFYFTVRVLEQSFGDIGGRKKWSILKIRYIFCELTLKLGIVVDNQADWCCKWLVCDKNMSVAGGARLVQQRR